MASLSEYIQTVHFKVGSPDERLLSEYDFIRTILEVDDEKVTELNLSSQGWLVPRYTLTINPHQDTYSISQVGDFGRGIYMVTKKEGSLTHRAGMVKFVDEPELVMYYGGGSPGASGVEFSIKAAALITYNGERAIRVAPTPQMTATYQVVYEPRTSRPQSKQDKVFQLEQFDGYLTDLAAWKLLPHNTELDETRYGRLLTRLQTDIGRGDLRFRMYKQSDRQSNNIRAVPFGRSRWGHQRF